MINRLYVHNFRCLQNFDLSFGDRRSVLLIGQNGTGKTTVASALKILQKIARGTNRVRDLVRPADLSQQGVASPIRIEVEVRIDESIYSYAIAFELPLGWRELRILDERLAVDGFSVFTRDAAQVKLATPGTDREAWFSLDWHLVALTVVQERSSQDPLSIFKRWLAHMLLLRPVPIMMRGDSDHETTQPDDSLIEYGAWFKGLMISSPSSYAKIDAYLKEVMPDLLDVQNPTVGHDSHSLFLRFKTGTGDTIALPFHDLSDGEKCFMAFALALAANDAYGPVLCFWDEPDNFLAPSEVGPSIMALRRAFRDKGQLIVTSHNPEAVRRFSDENTLILSRVSHLEPANARWLEDVRAAKGFEGSIVDALARGDIDV